MNHDRRKPENAEKRKEVDRTDALYRQMRCVTIVLLAGVCLALAAGGKGLIDRANDNERAIKDLRSVVRQINQTKLENTIAVCLERNDQNGVIREFVLFASDSSSPLYLQAVKVFPIKGKNARKECGAEAKQKIEARP